MILAGDIGGTKAVLALCDPDGEGWRTVREQRFECAAYDDLKTIVAAFLDGVDPSPAAAAFGVAGPVFGGRAKVTNLPWTVDAEAISRRFAIPSVTLLNDLAATATAVLHLGRNDLATIQEGEADPEGARAVIAPGTGLGEAFVVWSRAGWVVCPTEGGHATFAPANAEQFALMDFVSRRFGGHVSFERVCSGSGIPNLYDFLHETGRYEQPHWLGEALAAADDRTPVIVNAALENRAPICTATLDLFTDILACEIGNLALKTFATGGVYIGGGIPPRILERLRRPEFIADIANKGRFAGWIAGLPIHVILDPQAALHGAAWASLAAVRGTGP